MDQNNNNKKPDSGRNNNWRGFIHLICWAVLLAALEDRQLMVRADSLDMTSDETLVINYDGRFRVEMYYSADFDYKLHCLEETVALLQPNETGIIRMTMKDERDVRFIPSG